MRAFFLPGHTVLQKIIEVAHKSNNYFQNIYKNLFSFKENYQSTFKETKKLFRSLQENMSEGLNKIYITNINYFA